MSDPVYVKFLEALASSTLETQEQIVVIDKSVPWLQEMNLKAQTRSNELTREQERLKAQKKAAKKAKKAAAKETLNVTTEDNKGKKSKKKTKKNKVKTAISETSLEAFPRLDAKSVVSPTIETKPPVKVSIMKRS